MEKYFQEYSGEIFRLVEGQHFIATRKLVDSDEEQNILEELIDKSKPPVSTKNSRGQLHYLLYTPFRYPPLKHGGRFHTRAEQSVFYGAEELGTSMAEIAYGRFLFMEKSEANLASMQVPYTHFVAKLASQKAVLLTQEPFASQRSKISDQKSYGYSQGLGSSMRQSGVEMFTYFSARVPTAVNIGLFSSEAFAQNKPVSGKEKHWSVYISQESVEFQSLHIRDNKKESHIFKIEDFYIKGKFPYIA